MEYGNFISELERLTVEARSIAESFTTHEDRHFRKWRHNVQSVYGEAKAKGFPLPGEFNSSRRAYRALWNGATREENDKAFTTELNDSIVELEFIIEHYRKYGIAAAALTVTRTSLEVPERVTLSWLFKNVPVTLWLGAAGLAIAIFLFGVSVGQTALYKNVATFLKSVIP